MRLFLNCWSSILYNLMAVGLEMFYDAVWICVFVFSSGSVFCLFVFLFFWCDILHCLVCFKVILCVLSLLPWIIEYIVLYHPSPWGFVGSSYPFISVCPTACQGRIFHFFFWGSSSFLSLELFCFGAKPVFVQPALRPFFLFFFLESELTFPLCFYFSHQNQRITVTPSEFFNAAS